MARTKHCYLGGRWCGDEDAGVGISLLFLSLSSLSLISLSTLPLFQSSLWLLFPFFLHYPLPNVGVPESSFTDEVILLSSPLSSKHYAKQIFKFFKLPWYSAPVFRWYCKLKLLLVYKEGDRLNDFSSSFQCWFPRNFQNSLISLLSHGPLWSSSHLPKGNLPQTMWNQEKALKNTWRDVKSFGNKSF